MMSVELYMAFIAASVLLALVPGPSMAMFVATSTTRGTKAGFTTIAGNSAGLVVLVAAAVLGMAPMLSLVAHWFDYIRLAGAAYLVWIGITYIRAGLKEPEAAAAVKAPHRRLFKRALTVSLSNPKTLLFLGAFFPQFIDPAHALTPQLIVLGITFVITLTLVDSLIVLMSGYSRRWLLNHQRKTHIGSGMLLISAGAALALARK